MRTVPLSSFARRTSHGRADTAQRQRRPGDAHRLQPFRIAASGQGRVPRREPTTWTARACACVSARSAREKERLGPVGAGGPDPDQPVRIPNGNGRRSAASTKREHRAGAPMPAPSTRTQARGNPAPSQAPCGGPHSSSRSMRFVIHLKILHDATALSQCLRAQRNT